MDSDFFNRYENDQKAIKLQIYAWAWQLTLKKKVQL
jgi:hypothetical protein